MRAATVHSQRPVHSRRPSAQLTALISSLLLGWASTAAAGDTLMLGQTASADIIVDGSAVPSGTTLLSPSVLETGSNPARVYLAQGQILELAGETRVYLQATPWGELEIVVDGGAVVVQGDEAEPVTAAAGERLVFVQPEVQVAQLGGSSSGAALALPVVALASGGCTVDSSGQCSPSDDSCSDREGTCECVKKDPATGICEECGCSVPAALAPAGGGLSKGAKIGIGIGAAAGVAILINELDDDDEPPASPVN